MSSFHSTASSRNSIAKDYYKPGFPDKPKLPKRAKKIPHEPPAPTDRNNAKPEYTDSPTPGTPKTPGPVSVGELSRAGIPRRMKPKTMAAEASVDERNTDEVPTIATRKIPEAKPIPRLAPGQFTEIPKTRPLAAPAPRGGSKVTPQILNHPDHGGIEINDGARRESIENQKRLTLNRAISASPVRGRSEPRNEEDLWEWMPEKDPIKEGEESRRNREGRKKSVANSMAAWGG